MKIVFVTIPLRGEPEIFPPFGSLCVMKYLRKNGFQDTKLLNFDFSRPSPSEAIKQIIAESPDVIGISAVVSTSYAYVKELLRGIKAAGLQSLIVVGGAMVASAEVLLRRAGADICVIGEGEQPMVDICRRAETTRNPTEFRDIGGLALLDDEDRLLITGFVPQLPADQLYDIDWADLEATADINWYFASVTENPGKCENFLSDPRSEALVQANKRVGTLVSSRGCVARCTFCHRLQKGIRYVPVDILISRVIEVMEKYNVGFLRFTDENFGTDKRWLTELCEKIKPLGVLWSVGGMRVNCVDPHYIQMMKDSGCVAIIYGMESGSQRILDVMEKKTTVEENMNAMKWTTEAGLWTVVQLIMGMPGETRETVRETAEFAAYALTLSRQSRPGALSINYAQALPGTPLYEFGRKTGRIDGTPEGEEHYLLRISDRDAYDTTTSINFTDAPRIEWESWRPYINLRVALAYVKKFGREHYLRQILYAGHEAKMAEIGFFNDPKRMMDREIANTRMAEPPPLLTLLRQGKFGLAQACYPVFSWRLRGLQWAVIFLRLVKAWGPRRALSEAVAYGGYLIKSQGWRFRFGYRSLRKIVDKELPPLPTDDPAMEPMRKGR
ncbi:MAG: Fe-S oxidoreductase [Stygiobacter sp.]|nr:MAG: Fe-S oxidoreductase [Stygiobacter sp.]